MVGSRRQDGLQFGLQLLLRAFADGLTADYWLCRELWRWFTKLVARVLVLVAAGASDWLLQRHLVVTRTLLPSVRPARGRLGFASSGGFLAQGEGGGRTDRLVGTGNIDTRTPLAGQLATDRARQLAVG